MTQFKFKNYEDAIDFLVRTRLEPYWDSQVLFRSIRGGRTHKLRVSRQSQEKSWPILRELLHIKTKEACDRVRDVVLSRIRNN